MTDRTDSPKTARAAPSWYRVEFDNSGRMIACDPAEAAVGASGWVVVYVQAKDEDGAKLAAQRERQKLMQRDRRKRYREQGLCSYCGRERADSTLKKCLVCTERTRESNRRSDARKNSPDLPRQNPGARQRERRASLEQSERLSVLLEVQAEWRRILNSKKGGSFSEWLAKAIEAAKKPKGSEDKAA